ncbi:hypothetical protein KP509_23G030200 [Ceratopteris richardii]|nr:hypothetical protein KP509_23G030200 [Ceratopteris richardii]
MQDLGLQPEKVTFLSVLKACGSIHLAYFGRLLHQQIISFDLDTEISIQNSLIDMYSDCGNIWDAYALFIRLSTRNVITWTIIITAFARSYCCNFAFHLYGQMLHEGVKPNKFTYMAILQACIRGQNIGCGMTIHDHVIRDGLGVDAELGSTIISMYSSCGNLPESQKVFDGLIKRDIVSWGAVISGYSQNDDGLNVIRLFKSMQEEGFKADKCIYSSILKACAMEKDIALGQSIHNELLASKLHLHVIVGTALIDMHIEFGNLDTARRLFDDFPEPNDIMGGTLIKGFVQHGYAFSALQLFEKMQMKLIKSNQMAYMFVLKACVQVGYFREGKLIHDQVIRHEFEVDTFMENSLIEFYVHFGQFSEAELMFHGSEKRNLRTWTILLEGYLHHSLLDPVLRMFEHMQMEAVRFDAFTFDCVLRACDHVNDLRIVHDHIIRHNFEKELIIGNTLLTSYSSCGCTGEALMLLQKSEHADISSWTAFMGGLVECGHFSMVFSIFDDMQESTLQPSEITFLCLLKACIMMKDAQKGRLVHDKVIRSGLNCCGLLGNALTDVYGSCGHLYEAKSVFTNLDCHDEISCGTIIAAHCQHDCNVAALDLVQRMQCQGVALSTPILLSSLKACGKLGAVVWAKLMHHVAIINGLDNDLAIISTLIYVYGECSYKEDAHKLFYSVPIQDIAMWSIFISNFQSVDLVKESLAQMQAQGIEPNAKTFTNVLAAYAREGLLGEVTDFCKVMHEGCLDSNLLHCTSIANLLCRTGHIEVGYDLLQVIPLPSDQVTWRTLLSGSKFHKDIGLGEYVFEQDLEVDTRNLRKQIQSYKCNKTMVLHP